MKSLEQQLVEANDKIKQLETESKQLKESAAQAVKAKAIAESTSKLKTMLDEAKLPEALAKKIAKDFEAAESDKGFKEAIESAQDLVKELGGKVTVRKNLGDNGNKDSNTTEADKTARHARLVESYKAMNMTQAEAEAAAKQSK